MLNIRYSIICEILTFWALKLQITLLSSSVMHLHDHKFCFLDGLVIKAWLWSSARGLTTHFYQSLLLFRCFWIVKLPICIFFCLLLEKPFLRTYRYLWWNNILAFPLSFFTDAKSNTICIIIIENICLFMTFKLQAYIRHNYVSRSNSILDYSFTFLII
jgi:hypothetical protein